jgi:hypothetical protein
VNSFVASKNIFTAKERGARSYFPGCEGSFATSRFLRALRGFAVYHQCPQDAQLPPAHESQECSDMPETALPPLSAKKTDSLRLVCVPPQMAHWMGASAWLIERNSSKTFSQSSQVYS